MSTWRWSTLFVYVAACGCGPKSPEDRLIEMTTVVREAEKICGIKDGEIKVGLLNNSIAVNGGCSRRVRNCLAPYLAQHNYPEDAILITTPIGCDGD